MALLLRLAPCLLLCLVLGRDARAAGVIGYTFQSFSNSAAMTIPAQGAASLYPSSISVVGVTGALGKVTVTLSALDHAWPSDLDVLLVGPSGRSVLLMSDVGGEWSATNLTVTFDDEAASPLPHDAPLYPGTYKPSDYTGDEIFWDLFDPPAPAWPYGAALTNFHDVNSNGRWDLFVMDNVAYDAGILHGGWSLTFVSEQPLVSATGGADETIVQPNSVWAEARSATMIAVHAPFTGDTNRNGYTIHEVGTSAQGPWSTTGVAVASDVATVIVVWLDVDF